MLSDSYEDKIIFKTIQLPSEGIPSDYDIKDANRVYTVVTSRRVIYLSSEKNQPSTCPENWKTFHGSSTEVIEKTRAL